MSIAGGRWLAFATSVILGVAGCATHGPPAGTPAGGPSGSDSPSIGGPTGDRPYVAVVRHSGGLDLDRVEPRASSLTRVRALDPPAPGAHALSVSLSAGTSPTICAVWLVGSSTSLTCYGVTDSTGSTIEVATAAKPVQASVSFDGRFVAWAGGAIPPAAAETATDPDIAYCQLSATRQCGPVVRVPAQPKGTKPLPAEAGGTDVNALAWAGDDAFLISAGHQSDDGSHLIRAALGIATAGGYAHGAAVSPPAADTRENFFLYDGLVSSTGSADAIAVERSGVSDSPFVTRAVRINVDTGAVERVLARPLAGRRITSVSGGDNGIVFQTLGDSGLRTYWSGASGNVGTPLIGLPSDATIVLAQP